VNVRRKKFFWRVTKSGLLGETITIIAKTAGGAVAALRKRGHQTPTDHETKGWKGVSVECLGRAAILLILASMVGCRGSQPDNPEPPPTPAGPTAIVVLYDAKAESDMAVYASPDLDDYAEKHSLQLRIHPNDAIDENGKTPGYLMPYVEAANGKQLPIAMVGKAGKVLATLERPTDAQAIISLAENLTAKAADEDSDAIWAGGSWRKLTAPKLMVMRPGAAARWTLEGSTKAEPLIPQERWKDVSLASFSRRVADQDGVSSCCPTSGNSALELFVNRTGLKPVKLSALDAYYRINGGRDAGAMLEDYWSMAIKDGVCTTDYCAEQGSGTRPPLHKSGHQADRAKHRPVVVTLCESWEAMASALQRHKPVHFGLMVDSGFSPDPTTGIIARKSGRNRGGHAVLAIGMRKIGDKWFVLMLNSWSDSWGGSKDGTVPKGCCLLTPAYFESAFGAFAVASIRSPSDDPIVCRPKRSAAPAIYAMAN
jgi:hypothetical protein